MLGLRLRLVWWHGVRLVSLCMARAGGDGGLLVAVLVIKPGAGVDAVDGYIEHHVVNKHEVVPTNRKRPRCGLGCPVAAANFLLIVLLVLGLVEWFGR